MYHDILLIVRRIDEDEFRVLSIISQGDQDRIRDALEATEPMDVRVDCSSLTLLMKLKNKSMVRFVCGKEI